MKPEEIKKLAIECGVLFDKYGDIVNMDVDQLAAYTAAVEAPLQARIAQLEEALKMMLEAGESEYREDWVAATRNGNFMLSGSSSTWLSEHDKEVAAKERERCAVKCESIAATYFDHAKPPYEICAKAIRELQ